ncbi:MAG: LytR C-terminal domain-containing protein [Candidatus Roizmanbacteria bacterium]
MVKEAKVKKFTKKSVTEDVEPVVESVSLVSQPETIEVTVDPLMSVNNQQESPVVDSPSSINIPRGKRNIFWLVLPIVLISVGIIGGIFIYRTGSSNENNKNQELISPSPTAIPKQTVLPTTAEEIDLKSYKIKVLNGSGIAGVAAKVSDVLKDKGFDVLSPGNADKSDYKETVIQVKKMLMIGLLKI